MHGWLFPVELTGSSGEPGHYRPRRRTWGGSSGNDRPGEQLIVDPALQFVFEIGRLFFVFFQLCFLTHSCHDDKLVSLDRDWFLITFVHDKIIQAHQLFTLIIVINLLLCKNYYIKINQMITAWKPTSPVSRSLMVARSLSLWTTLCWPSTSGPLWFLSLDHLMAVSRSLFEPWTLTGCHWRVTLSGPIDTTLRSLAMSVPSATKASS